MGQLSEPKILESKHTLLMDPVGIRNPISRKSSKSSTGGWSEEERQKVRRVDHAFHNVPGCSLVGIPMGRTRAKKAGGRRKFFSVLGCVLSSWMCWLFYQ